MTDEEYAHFHRLVKRSDAIGLRNLIRSGWSVNSADMEGWRTPLLWVHGNTAFIRILIEAGADVNPTIVHGMSPLAAAAQKGHTKAVSLLLRCGARTDVTPYGCSLLTYAITGGGRNHPKIFELLRAAGAREFHGNLHLKSYPAGFGPVG